MSLLKRKIIFWCVIIVSAAGLLFWQFSNFKKRLNDFQMGQFLQQLNLPDFNKIKTDAQKEINQ